jgi:hypothetical protein
LGSTTTDIRHAVSDVDLNVDNVSFDIIAWFATEERHQVLNPLLILHVVSVVDSQLTYIVIVDWFTVVQCQARLDFGALRLKSRVGLHAIWFSRQRVFHHCVSHELFFVFGALFFVTHIPLHSGNLFRIFGALSVEHRANRNRRRVLLREGWIFHYLSPFNFRFQTLVEVGGLDPLYAYWAFIEFDRLPGRNNQLSFWAKDRDFILF